MRKLVILLASCVAMPALAADLPAKAPRQAPVAVADWTGFYVGVHGGYGWGDAKVDAPFQSDLVEFVPLFADPSPKGWVFGGHAGYNWQWGAMVGGLEIDYSKTDIKESTTSDITVEGSRVFLRASRDVKFDQLGSARARLGFLLMPSILAYGTAGVGWGHSSATAAASACVPGTCVLLVSQTANVNSFGWVAGGGLEAKLGERILVRAEYLHYDFDDASYNFPLSNVGTLFFNANAKTSVDVVRGGLSLKF
jgi:outer membrane immunogenic protein